MATDQKIADYIVGQIQNAGAITTKKMFGEYGIYADGKMFGLIADNQLFIKPTDEGRSFIGQPTEAPPYPGAKNSFLIEDKIEDVSWLSQLVRTTLAALPEPKPKKSR